ncbi:MAG: Gfo/Idh/MocA family protein [Thermomicrobiales bacterium]
MEPVRLGIVGCGVIGTRHLQTATDVPETEVVAIADVREDVAHAAAARFGVSRVYNDAEALFADPAVEGVILALPAFARTDLALRAFAHGKHVLTEKPVARNAGEVQQMIAARGELVAGCCSARYRFLASSEAVASFLASGALGEIRTGRCRAIKSIGVPPQAPPPNWRLSKELNGGGILVNWGSYDLDYLFGVTGWSLVPETVLAQTWTIAPEFASYVTPNSDAETHVAALIQCAGGVTFTYERGEYMAAAQDEAWEITGTRGTLHLPMVPSKGKAIVHDEATSTGVVSHTIWSGAEDFGMTHTGLEPDFARAIREHRQPRTSLEQALLVQRVTDAIYASAAQGRAVSVE